MEYEAEGVHQYLYHDRNELLDDLENAINDYVSEQLNSSLEFGQKV